MQVTAKAKYLRTSPRKIRLVIDLVRGMDAGQALIQLNFLKKAAAEPVRKAIASAVANATNNFKLEKNNLYITKITADEGPTLKRWRPRAFGRATPIRKRSTHLTVILEEKVPTQKAAEVKKEAKGKAKKLEVVTAKPKEALEPEIAEEPEKEEVVAAGTEEGKPEIFDERLKGKHRDLQHQDKREMKKGGKSFAKRLFNRKSGT